MMTQKTGKFESLIDNNKLLTFKEIWILATFITSSLTTSADVRNPNAAGRELVGQILFKNVTL